MLGSQDPCFHLSPAPAPHLYAFPCRYSTLPYSPPFYKWRLEVLTRASGGTDYTYYRYVEGAEPFIANFTGQPVILGADKLIVGIDK